jgi:protein gp37
MGNTTIEWADKVWNPVRGCTRVSPGCTHCYAEVMAGRFSKPGLWGHGFAVNGPAGKRWTGKVSLIPEKLVEPLSWRNPARCFVNSTSDLFHEELSNEDIAAVYGVMAACPHITFQVLTKRPERRQEFQAWLRRGSASPQASCYHIARSALDEPQRSTLGMGGGWPLGNVWEGTSVENRGALPRIDHLRETPAALRFLSLEPLLEDLGTIDLSGIGWVIVGGESGHGSRPMHPAWVRSLRDQCVAAGVPFFFKQWGEWKPVEGGGWIGRASESGTRKARSHSWPGESWQSFALGKHATGRLLDGREWNEFPEVPRG